MTQNKKQENKNGIPFRIMRKHSGMWFLFCFVFYSGCILRITPVFREGVGEAAQTYVYIITRVSVKEEGKKVIHTFADTRGCSEW